MTHNDIKNITYLDVVKSPRFSYTKQKDVFWPFLLWRVLAPKSQPELNVFQVLILKLLKAGCSSKESICEYSNLDGELVRYMLLELQSKGLIDDWNITQEGRDRLKGIEAKSDETVSYYLVQDALTGQLLPRVLTRLSYIDSMDFSEEYPAFIISRSSGKKRKPLLIKTGKTSVEQPSVEQMADCLRGFRRDQRKLIQADIDILDNEQRINNSISLIEDKPIPVFIHLKLFSVYYGNRMWYLSDPTGLTNTVPELNDIAEQVMSSNKQLASSVIDVLGIADDEGNTSSYSMQQDEFSEKAKLELLSEYSWTQQHDMIREHVLSMLRLKIQVEHEKKIKQEVLRSLLAELQMVIEAWIKTFMSPDKNCNDWQQLVMRWNKAEPIFQSNRAILKEIYLRTNGVSPYAALRLATVRGGNVRAALTLGNQSLKPMLAAIILKFPLVVEELNREYLNWLDLVIKLADDRNSKGSHANSQGVTLTKEEIMNHVNSVEKLLTVLENLIGNN